MEDEAALWRAADELPIEIANQIDVVLDHTPYDLFTPDRRPG